MSGYCNESRRKANRRALATAGDCVYGKPVVQAPGWEREFVEMIELRRHIRVATSAIVEMQHPLLGLIEVKARDLSDGGIFALMGTQPAPPLGTEMLVRIKRYTGTINHEPVRMRVVHHQAGGVGLAFIG
jgi:hypothetical protein